MKAVSTPLDRSEKPVAGDVGIDALVKEDAVETLQQGSHGTERMRRDGQELMGDGDEDRRPALPRGRDRPSQRAVVARARAGAG